MPSMMPIAFCAISSFVDPTWIMPSSCTSMLQPVSSMMERIIRPPGPMMAPILSTGILIW